jgi:XTP/dITP diphosphohydrolase
MAASVLIASNNSHKLQEFREIFQLHGANDIALFSPQALGIHLDPDETAETYLENARIKARAFHNLLHQRSEIPRMFVLADDSGLEVDALGGGPGVRSARFHKAAPDKDGCAALLTALTTVSDDQRKARFRCVVVLLDPEGQEHTFEGTCEGSIGFDKRGAGGFGFDPVFRVESDSRHLAELSAEEKHQVSHRGKAARKVIDFLKNATR